MVSRKEESMSQAMSVTTYDDGVERPVTDEDLVVVSGLAAPAYTNPAWGSPCYIASITVRC
jgi:hypothetical protein